MGQKVNPTGFRLGVQGWNNSCPPGKDYSLYIYEDMLIESRLVEFLSKTGNIVDKVCIDRKNTGIFVTVSLYRKYDAFQFSTKDPLRFLIKSLERNVTKNFPINVNLSFYNLPDVSEKMKDDIHIVKICLGRPSSNFLAKYLAEKLEKTPKHIGVINSFQQTFNSFVEGEKNPKLKGLLVQVKGRINGADRSQRSLVRYGSLPLHTIDAPIDYAFVESVTPYGICGIKVWMRFL